MGFKLVILLYLFSMLDSCGVDGSRCNMKEESDNFWYSAVCLEKIYHVS
jgi:hypothetical protein